jgi:hypothetical protein
VQTPISPEAVEKERFREKHMKTFLAKKSINSKPSEDEELSEVDEDASMVEQMKARLKGRQYTYDQNGNIIIVKSANLDKLPEYQLAPHISVQESQPDSPKKRGRSSRAKKPSSSTKEAKQKPAVHFKRALEVQPPITETMEVG